jgi:hypothetical protein
MTRLLTGLLLCALALGASACGTSDQRPRRGDAPVDYAAVPDEELFTAVETLPTVRSADLGYVDQLGESNTYRAQVDLEPGLPRPQVAEVYDQVVEVLRHGRWGAATLVTVTSGDVVEQGGSRDLRTGEDYQDAYGPQTGREGWPPPFLAES